MQSLNRAVPLEEQLREVAALPVGQPWSAARVTHQGLTGFGERSGRRGRLISLQ
jgi:hypothetical protein